MYKELNLWIAQSASWQSYIDFRLSTDVISNYNFIEQFDDFYISLLSNAYDILEGEDIEARKHELFDIARGIEIYSLNEKRNHFRGVDYYKNILYAASFYYLADYSASAVLLARLFNIENYTNEVDIFISGFLRREFPINKYSDLLKEYSITGEIRFLNKLIKDIDSILESSIRSNGNNYISLLLSKRILERFKSNNIWSDLLNYNSNAFWKNFVKAKMEKEIPIWDFFPSQRAAILSGLIDKNETISIQMPTSSGKTAICELIAFNEFQDNKNCKILYLAPFRALASELKQSFGKSLRNLGVKVKTIYGGNIPTQEEKIAIENSNLLIATPEKFMAIEESDPSLVDNFTTIICDEGHLIDDTNRGLSYELLLTRLKGEKRFVFISAIIPNIDIINSWLGGKADNVIKSNYRPTKLDFAFLFPSKDGFMLDVNPTNSIPINYKLNKFILQDEYYYFNTKTNRLNKYPQSEKTISATVALKSIPSGSVALFATAKGKKTGVRGLVNEINKQIKYKLNLPNPLYYADKTHIEKLIEYFSYIFSTDYTLTESARNGFLYHNGDLPQFVREIIEESLRTNKVRLVVCTNTLAEGVNLPIKTIVLHSVTRKFKAPDSNRWITEFVNLRDLKNLVGRAGRAGKETKGLIIATKQKEFKYLSKLIKDEDIEPVKGYLYNLVKDLNEQIEKYSINLSNEILDKQNESFLRMLDRIDSSIIHLLDINVTEEKVDPIIEHLLYSTLSSFQSSKEENKVLLNLFSLRSQKIKPYIAENKLQILKTSGANVREFIDYEKYIDFDNKIIQTLSNPTADEWFKYLFDETLFKFSHFLNIFNEFSISPTDLKLAVNLWLNGKWYGEISNIFDGDIDFTLKIINKVILYDIQNTVSQIINLIALKYTESEKEISPQVLKFPQYLLNGTKKETVLDLIEVGFSDRVSNEQLGIIVEKQFDYKEISELKTYLVKNEDAIIDLIENKIPILSKEILINNFETLKYYG